jgi:hypothetical protein
MKTIFSLIVLLVVSGSMLAQTTDTSLVAFYPFNGNAIDESGNEHDGTVNGGVLTMTYLINQTVPTLFKSTQILFLIAQQA